MRKNDTTKNKSLPILKSIEDKILKGMSADGMSQILYKELAIAFMESKNEEDATALYRALALQLHPDKIHVTQSNLANKFDNRVPMQLLNEVYENKIRLLEIKNIKEVNSSPKWSLEGTEVAMSSYFTDVLLPEFDEKNSRYAQPIQMITTILNKIIVLSTTIMYVLVRLPMITASILFKTLMLLVIWLANVSTDSSLQASTSQYYIKHTNEFLDELVIKMQRAKVSELLKELSILEQQFKLSTPENTQALRDKLLEATEKLVKIHAMDSDGYSVVVMAEFEALFKQQWKASSASAQKAGNTPDYATALKQFQGVQWISLIMKEYPLSKLQLASMLLEAFKEKVKECSWILPAQLVIFPALFVALAAITVLDFLCDASIVVATASIGTVSAALLTLLYSPLYLIDSICYLIPEKKDQPKETISSVHQSSNTNAFFRKPLMIEGATESEEDEFFDAPTFE